MSEARLLTEPQIIMISTKAETIKMGIYFLIKDQRVVYVGQSVHIDARLIAHQRAGKVWDRWCWLPCPPELLDYLERQYLDALLPPWNIDLETRIKRGDSVPREESPPLPHAEHPLDGIDLQEWPQDKEDERERLAEHEAMKERITRLRAMRLLP